MTEPLDASFPEIPGYRIESILGRGSMARVFRGRQLGIDRPVAIKVLRDEVVENEKILKRLMREARIAARFNHPHIVRALDAGVHEGSCYFVMDLVEGRSLREIVEREGPLDEQRALGLAIQIAEALSELHRSHVVHRDVKPANVIVDLEGRALLADLGLAKIEFDASMTSRHRTVGTPAYMAPEQARDPDRVDSRCDLFSLGATIFYLLSGHSPFEGPTVSAVITKILYEEAPPLSKLVPGVSPELEQVVVRLLDKDRGRRYQTPSALLRDLRALQRGAALPVGPAAAPRDPRKLAALATAAVVVLALLGYGILRDSGASDEDVGPGGAELPLERPERPERPLIDEARLEEDLDRVLGSIEAALRSKIASGDTAAARAALEGAWRERFEREMGATLAELPRVASLRWENACLEFERRLAAEDARLRDLEAAELRQLLDREIARLERSEVFLDRDEIVGRLEEIDAPTLERLDRAALAISRGQAADRLLATWRREFDREMERARLEEAAGRHDASLAILAALDDRRAVRLGPSAGESLAQLRGLIERDRGETARRVTAALAMVDVLPPLGSPRLAARDFGDVLERLDPVLTRLPADERADEARTLRLVAEVLREAAAWPERLVAMLRAERIAAETELVDRRGRSHRVGDLVEIGDEGLIFGGAGAIPETVPLNRLDVSGLATLVGGDDPALAARARAFLAYCDGDLLDAELGIERLEADDPFRSFMNARLAAAWVVVAHVNTPEDKEAFRAWAATLAAFRAGDHEGAALAAEPLRSDESLRRSAWYREKRKDIRRVLEQVDRRVRIARKLGARAASFEVVKLDPPVVRGSWTFAREEEAADFVLGEGHGWRSGELARLAPEPGGRIAPDEVTAIRLDLDADPAAQPVELEFVIRGSAKTGEEPRCLVVSLFGHHLGILSRLRQSLAFRHLELHGAERLIHDYVEFGRVAAWSGELAAYRSALGTASAARRLVLEPGRRHRLAIRLDPADSSLVLRVDGEEILRRKLERLDLGISGIEIRAPMPFALESLQVSAALRL